ncbi:MAG TPA: ATP-binding protein [Steroidobacteraceae bacterium]|nr:ATP-binding protein [Steroidobacteraceae bacterium]
MDRELDFRLLFGESPEVLLVLLPDAPRYTMVAATNARLRATHTTRETLGRGLFEVFPDNPDDPSATGTSNLRASLERVLTTRQADSMPVQKYDIRGPDGKFEVRYWSPKNLPVLSPSGEVRFILHRAEDVTGLVRARELGDELRGRTREIERMKLLDRITRGIAERQDLRSIFQIVIRNVEENLPAACCCICLSDYEGDGPTAGGAPGRKVTGQDNDRLAIESALAHELRTQSADSTLARCLQGTLIYEPDVSQLPLPLPEQLAAAGMRSVVASPLRVESQVLGVLLCARREVASFSEAEGEFLRQLSEHVALAAHQARLYGALQRAYNDLRQSQQTIMQQERLRALGEMASGIAHDINNAISPAALYTEMLQREPGLSDKARENLRTIQTAVEDVAETVARMREFYRPRESELVLSPVSCNRLLQQVIELTRARWSDLPQQRGIVIQLRTQLAEELPDVMGSEAELRDALINLVFNAVDAMSEGGTLTVTTRVAASGGHGTDPAARHVCVEIADTGIGMDEETRRRCLEPFYTTKGERGTGLGLAMVYGTVQRHSAEIEIDSARGRGTTVRLLFLAAQQLLDARASTTAAQPVLAHRMRILLVDDDPMLTHSLQDVLSQDGHEITVADGGQKGIDAFNTALAQDRPFALVITDLGMPYVDGRTVAASVKAAAASTPVILLTGWGRRLLADQEIPPHVDRVLSKPPRLAELRAALAELASPEVDDRRARAESA